MFVDEDRADFMREKIERLQSMAQEGLAGHILNRGPEATCKLIVELFTYSAEVERLIETLQGLLSPVTQKAVILRPVSIHSGNVPALSVGLLSQTIDG